jgi:hypothetical protein
MMNMERIPTFFPWLFDSREAWEKSVNDPRYQYEMPMDSFMTLYQEYRSGVPTAAETEAILAGAFAGAEATSSNAGSSISMGGNDSEENSILSQDEIDMLLSAGG